MHAASRGGSVTQTTTKQRRRQLRVHVELWHELNVVAAVVGDHQLKGIDTSIASGFEESEAGEDGRPDEEEADLHKSHPAAKYLSRRGAYVRPAGRPCPPKAPTHVSKLRMNVTAKTMISLSVYSVSMTLRISATNASKPTHVSYTMMPNRRV